MITFGESGWFGVISEEIDLKPSASLPRRLQTVCLSGLILATVVLGYDTRFLSREYACVCKRC